MRDAQPSLQRIVDWFADIDKRFDSWFSRLFIHGHVHPLQIERDLEVAMDEAYDPRTGVAAGQFDIWLGIDDYEFYTAPTRSLVVQLEDHVRRHARSRHYHLSPTEPSVHIHLHERMGQGRIQVRARAVEEIVREEDEAKRPVGTLTIVPGTVQRGRERTYDIMTSTVTIGRAEDNEIVLNDQRVSRRHAELSYTHGVWTIRDCGSHNGTHVNGKAIASVRLQPGDLLRIGGVELEWQE